MATSYDFIQPPANTGVGKQVRATTITEGSGPASGTSVLQQVVNIADPATVAAQLNVVQINGDGVANTNYTALDVPFLINSSGTADRQRAATGTTGIPAVNTEGTRASYSIGGLISPAATATDIAIINGSGSKTIKVTRVEISITATASGIADVFLIKRSTANSGGTGTTPTPVAHDSTDSAASAVVTQYSANPTPGSSVGTIRATKIGITGSGGTNTYTWTFTERNTRGLTLRGVAQGLAINLNGDALLTGEVIAYSIEWTEE